MICPRSPLGDKKEDTQAKQRRERAREGKYTEEKAEIRAEDTWQTYTRAESCIPSVREAVML